MTIQFACTGCKTPLQLPDEMGGSRARCVQCGAVFTIPSATAHYWPPGSKQAAVTAGSSAAVAAPRAAATKTPPLPRRAASPSDSSVSHAPLAMPVAGHTSSAGAATAVAHPHAATQSASAAPPALNAGCATSTQGASRPVMILDVEDCETLEEPDVRHSSLRADDILKRAWGIYKNNFSAFLAAGLLIVALVGFAHFAVVAFMQLIGAPLLVQLCVAQALFVWLAAGTMDYMLKAARGRRPSVARLFGGMPRFGTALVTWILCFVPLAIAAAGAAALGASPLVSAIGFEWLSLAVGFLIWLPALLALVDHEPSPIDALAEAIHYARRNFLPLAGLCGLSLVILVAGSVPAGLGLPLAIPFVLLVATVAYLRERAGHE
jgi:LSD1 subclass zinc finger protein